MAIMKDYYQKTVTGELTKELGIANALAVPRIEKVVINVGVGRMLGNASKPQELLAKIQEDLARITGQQPVVAKARKSIASFKIRAGQPVGIKVTLRGQRMYDFLDRLVHITLPRSRDFKGIPTKAVDGSGNLTIGIAEQAIFPETAESNISFGLEITTVTMASDREESIKLLRKLGFPLRVSPESDDPGRRER